MQASGGPRNSAPGTLTKLFFDAVEKLNRPDALQAKVGGTYQPISHRELNAAISLTFDQVLDLLLSKNPQMDKLFDQQSMEQDQEKRRDLVFEIDKKLQEDGARPILFHNRFATCWQPQLKGLTIMVNSLFNGWRMEDVWLEKKPTSPSAAEEPSHPAAVEKPALVPRSIPPGDTRAGAPPPESPAVSPAAPASRAYGPRATR